MSWLSFSLGLLHKDEQGGAQAMKFTCSVLVYLLILFSVYYMYMYGFI